MDSTEEVEEVRIVIPAHRLDEIRVELAADARIYGLLGRAAALAGGLVALLLAGPCLADAWSWGSGPTGLARELFPFAAMLALTCAVGAVSGCHRASGIMVSAEDLGYRDRGIQMLARTAVLLIGGIMLVPSIFSNRIDAAAQLVVAAAFFGPRWLAISSLIGRLAGEVEAAASRPGPVGKVLRPTGIRVTPTRAIGPSPG